jgi:hypothetical protein
VPKVSGQLSVNYFSLLPHETKSISIEFSEESPGVNKPKVILQKEPQTELIREFLI